MVTVLDSLNQALLKALYSDRSTIIIGEDILDPYGGAFKVTRGLSTAFPKRVFTTPVSEAGIVGIAAGMALRGLRPVVEIMFGDFVTLIADQLVNHVAKFRWMYNDQVRVPLVVRTPMGGRRGYGPTHSQTLEKIYLGIPGLRVLAPSNVQCSQEAATKSDLSDELVPIDGPGNLLLHAVLKDDDPVLFVENKLMYLAEIQTPSTLTDFEISIEPQEHQHINSYAATYNLSVRDAPPADITLSAYGHMAELARKAALRLAYEHEIFVELIIPTQLAPHIEEPVIASVQRTGRLLTVEEGVLSLGWGAEVLARVAEFLGPDLRVARRLAAQEVPIPASGRLEEAVLPGLEEIVQTVRKMV